MAPTPSLFAIVDGVHGHEVFAADADAVLADACAVLQTGHRSEVLRAIDAGTATGYLSERAFHEVGWMSAKSARGRAVDHVQLRAVIEHEYLPRLPVVQIPGENDSCWVPERSDLRDPDDVSHVQLAQLIGARAVYSHDKHIRGPGFAPATRDDYNRRVVFLSYLSTRRETEQSTTRVVGFAGSGTAETVSWASRRFEIKPAVVWALLAFAVAGLTYLVLAPPERRRRLSAAISPVIERASAALERSDLASRELAASVLVPQLVVSRRLELEVAFHLARYPDLNMVEIAATLDLTSTRKHELPALLRMHPSFERRSQYGWGVGRVRPALETYPSTSWRPADRL